MKQPQSFIEKCYKDKHGAVRLIQVPNLPLLVWIAVSAVRIFVKHGTPAHALDYIGFGALFTWAWLEIFDGDTYIRRLLGAIVLVMLIVNRI